MNKKIFVILQDSAMAKSINIIAIKEWLVGKGIPEDCISLELIPEGTGGSLVSATAFNSFQEAHRADSNRLLVMMSSSLIYGDDIEDDLHLISFALNLKKTFPKLKYAVSSTLLGKDWQPIDYWFEKTAFDKRSEELAENIFQIYTESK